jgi:hypothetical protein
VVFQIRDIFVGPAKFVPGGVVGYDLHLVSLGKEPIDPQRPRGSVIGQQLVDSIAIRNQAVRTGAQRVGDAFDSLAEFRKGKPDPIKRSDVRFDKSAYAVAYA